MPNTQLGIARRADPTYDAHGSPVPGGYGATEGPWPGLGRERGDGGWALNLDPAAWPVREHDLIVEPSTGRAFLVLTADLLQNTYDPIVDHVRVEARQRVGTSTEPGGPEFSAR
jgi:hypothetical protein